MAAPPPAPAPPPMAPKIEAFNSKPGGPVTLGDLLRNERERAAHRKKQLNVVEKPDEKKKNQGGDLMSELQSAVLRSKGKLKNTPIVQRNDQGNQVNELPNAIRFGIANLRKVQQRRPSMDEPRGNKPAVAPEKLIENKAKKGWTPKKKDIDVSGMGFTGKLSQFQCRACGKAMTTLNIIETPSGNFHEDCFFCLVCTKQIMGEYLTLNGVFCHPNCLNCSTCGLNLIDQGLMCTEDHKLFCSEHAPRENCPGCSKKLESGAAVQIGDQIWHQDCFKCSICSDNLSGSYMEQKGKVFCKPCHDQHILVKCARCDKPLSGQVFKVDNPTEGDHLHYHLTCYSCNQCKDKLKGKGGHVLRGDIYCAKKCYPLQKAMYEEEAAPTISESS